jgi:hypothetical protein
MRPKLLAVKVSRLPPDSGDIAGQQRGRQTRMGGQALVM